MSGPLRSASGVLRGRLHARDALADALPPRARKRLDAPRHESSAAALVLSPHLDDAVFSAWSTLTRRPAAVVNLFAGIPPAGLRAAYDRVAGAVDAARRMRERLDEDAQALALAGVTPVNLDFPEDAYRRSAPAARALATAVTDHVGAVSEVLAPAGIGGHPDHLLARRLALAWARRGMPVRLYADLPYCVTYGWPSWVTGRPPVAHLDVDAHWDGALGPLRGSGLGLEREPIALSAEERDAKLVAMRRYVTQYPTLSRGPLDVLAHPEVLPYEVTWRVVHGST